MFQFLMRMMVYPPRLCRCVIRAFFLIVAMSALVSCGDSVPTATATTSTLPAPPGLKKVFEIPGTGDTFTIKVYITGRPNPVVVQNLRLSADQTRIETFKVSLPEGRLELRLEYVVNVAGRDLVIAQTNAIERVFSAASPTIDFSGATLDYSNSDLNRDQDQDGWSTKDELTNEKDPFDPNSHPTGAPPAPVPQPPKNLRVDPGDGQLSLQWDAVEAADGYYVYFGTASDLSVDRYREQGGTRVLASTNTQTLSGLGNGTSYTVLVTTIKGQLESTAEKTSGTPAAASNSFLVRVNVSGLKETLIITLTHNGNTEDLTVTEDGRAAFSMRLPNGAAFTVTIKQNPTTQTCKIGSVTDNGSVPVDIKCDKPEHVVIANVTGLGTGTSLLELQNGTSAAVSVRADRLVTVDTALLEGMRYHVTIKSLSSDRQCTVLNSRGTVGTSDVSVEVPCSEIPNPGFRVGGTVTNLKGSLILSYTVNDAVIDEKYLDENGSYNFALVRPVNEAYVVKIKIQPTGQACGLVNSSGSVVDRDITNITMQCEDALTLDARPLNNQASLSWSGSDATEYNVYYSTDAACDYTNYTTCTRSGMVPNVLSPITVSGLVNGELYYFLLEAKYGSRSLFSNIAQARPGNLSMNAAVNAMAFGESGNLYVGGNFSEVTVPSGGAAMMDVATRKIVSNLLIAGDVYAAIPDRSGKGWYIGGRFTHVNGEPRRNLAHLIDKDNLDRDFAFDVDGPVHALFVDDQKLYLGGLFEHVGNDARKNLAAIDWRTKLLWSWNPSPDDEVTSMAVFDGNIYVAGKFKNIDGQKSEGVEAFGSTGQIRTGGGWPAAFRNESAIGTVSTLVVGPSRLYVGGNFDRVNGVNATGIAAFRSGSELDTNWSFQPANESPVRDVTAAELADEKMYLAAIPRFQVGGIGSPSPEIRVVDMVRGVELRSFGGCQQACSGSYISSLAVVADNLFWAIDKGSYLRSFDIGANRSYDAVSFNQAIHSLNSTGSYLFVSGEFDFVPGRGLTRTNLAALNQDGAALPWAPNTQIQIARLTVGKDLAGSEIIYVAGTVSSVGDSPLQLAAFDATGRRLESWNPTGGGNITRGSSSGTVSALAAKPGMLYLGGRFDSVGGVSVSNLAAIDSTGAITTTGIPTVRGNVASIALSDNDVILGGSFDQVGGVDRYGFAIVDADGTVKNDVWNPIIGSSVGAITRGNDVIYLAGTFLNSIGNPGTPVVKAVNL